MLLNEDFYNKLKKIDYVKTFGLNTCLDIIEKFRYQTDFEDDDIILGIEPFLKEYKKNVGTEKPNPKYINYAMASVIGDVVNDWVSNSSNEGSRDLEALLPYLNKLKNVAPQIFKPNASTNRMAYRGTEISQNKLKTFIKKRMHSSNWKRASIGGAPFMVYVKKEFPYKPHRKFQSWSVDPYVAIGFNDSDAILVTHTNDKDFYFNPKFMNDRHDEDEIIHYGKNLTCALAVRLYFFNEVVADYANDISKLKFKKENKNDMKSRIQQLVESNGGRIVKVKVDNSSVQDSIETANIKVTSPTGNMIIVYKRALRMATPAEIESFWKACGDPMKRFRGTREITVKDMHNLLSLARKAHK